jgi:histidinol phosphatase-like PHP family hydrolase
MERRTFIRNTGLAAGFLAASGLTCDCFAAEYEFPLQDLHVHTTKEFTIDTIVDIGKTHGIKMGIVEHPISWALKNDADLKQYIEKLRKYPVLIGLQPTYPGWSKNYSKELLAQVDYILMDPQMVPQGNGKIWRIWEFDTYIDDTEDFMKRYMDYALQILENEPINIFGWPLFLPVCIARDYYSLWTEERMQQILTAAKKRNIAIEINDMSHTPHDKFILKAKEQGLKFTFGSDSRNMNVGRLAYCKQIAKKCGLTAADFYLPAHKTGNL